MFYVCRVSSRCTRTLLHRDSSLSTSMHLQTPFLSRNTSDSFHMNGETLTRILTRAWFNSVRRRFLLHEVLFRYAYSWQIEGDYNWKTFMDGYQECYHCTYVADLLLSAVPNSRLCRIFFCSIGHPGFAKESRNCDSPSSDPTSRSACPDPGPQSIQGHTSAERCPA